ncbi:hypothetical protein, partial [Bartonella sp. CL42QHWL]|uniref:hypothetical protein n=1 Tax=Bartonella sp. CL42QHWL TaxID=3243528 RepID=UPI0035CEDF75
PVFAAGLSIRGATVQSSNLGNVPYPHGSHGSVVLAGDDDYCGVDNVIGRGGKQQASVTKRITAEKQYNRFITNQSFVNRNPYGTSTEKEAWIGEGLTDGNGGSGGYMGIATDGIANALPEAYGIYSFATGCGSAATGNYSTVFGAGATAKAGGAQAFGVSALAAGKASVAMGVGSEASGSSTVAIGGLATALGENSIAVGTKARAEKNFAIAIGTDAEAKASGSIAIGGRRSDRTEENDPNRKVTAEGENAIAIGSHTYAKTEDSVAIGANAQVLVNDGVAIGGGSVSDRNKGVKGYDPYLNGDTTEAGMAWVSTTGAFSVGEVGGRGKGNLTRQITGVAAGSEDTDAVNVAQLKAMREVIAGGGGWKLSANDTDPTDVHTGNTVDFSVKSKNDEGKDNLTVAKNTADNKHKIEFTLSDTLKLTSVTTGQSSMSDDGFIIQNGPMMTIDGIDAGNEKITNVADGEEDNDAVNYKQLKEFTAGIKEGGWKLSVEGNNATDVKAGSTVDFVAAASGDGSKNIKIEKDNNNKVTFSLNDALKLTSVTTGNSIMNSDGFKFIDGNGPSMSQNGIDAGNKQIIGVAEGTKDTDAVNYKQLKAVQEASKTHWQLTVNGESPMSIGQNDTINFEAAGNEDSQNIKIVGDGNRNVTFDLADDITVTSVAAGNSFMNNDGFMITGGPHMATGGIYAGNKKITGVLAGTDAEDAVNYQQLQDFTARIKTGWKLAVEDEEATDVEAESTVKFVGVNAEDGNEESKNIKITKNGDNTVKFDLNDIVRVKRVIAGKANVSDDGFVITGGPNMTTGGIYAGNKQIKGVEEGTLETDAVNVAQLNKIKNEIAGNSLVKWDEVQKLITIGKEKSGTKIDIAGNEGERTIAGVRNGKISENSTEAINGSQINQISGDIANFFGGNAAFENGVFVGPKYNLSTVSADGNVVQKTFDNVGKALEGLDVNIKNVNKHIQYVDNKFDKFSQDVLLWDDGKQAFSARHGKDGRKTDSKITNLLDGDISEESTDAINGSQLYVMGDTIANYFGGDASYENGEWTEPTFKISQREANGTITQKKHHNVADAFEGVDNSITDIYNQINNVTKNNLVKQEGDSAGLITVGKETGGTEISLVNKDGIDRTLSGVKDGELSQTSTQAVNGSQLFKTNANVTTVTNDLKTVAQNTSKYFGGSTDVLNGVEPSFLIQDTKYNNVFDAFTGVNTSITNIDNKIIEMKENSLVQQDKETNIITIGAKTAGTEINIAGYAKVARSISGVKAAEKGDEAVNKDQLDKSIKDITKDIETATAAAVLYDKNGDDSVNYGSVTLGGNKSNGPVALHNVKDGSLSQDSHDAINGSQINKISADIAKFFGGGAKFIDGAFKGLKYTVSAIVDGVVGKANFYNVGDALTGLDKNVQDVNQRLTNVSNEFNQ